MDNTLIVALMVVAAIAASPLLSNEAKKPAKKVAKTAEAEEELNCESFEELAVADDEAVEDQEEETHTK